ncbi:helix-turn-helix domain-containing protein [soil metagenome]
MTRERELVHTRPRARGLVSDRASGRRIDAETFPPPADLGDVVATFWSGAWDLRGQAPHVTELLSDVCLHFVFERGEEQGGSRVVGVWTRTWTRTLEGRGTVRGVKLRPGAAKAFLAEAATRFTDHITPLRAVFGAEVAALERAISSAPKSEQAFAVFADWLRLRRRSEDTEETRLAIAIVERIACDPSITGVDRLARVAGLHPRVLQRLFREHVGATPKLVIRRNRLREVATRIERGEAPSLADLAAELGYTDQAHLARDFKASVGKSPRAFAASLTK